jgi:hypothetical protein
MNRLFPALLTFWLLAACSNAAAPEPAAPQPPAAPATAAATRRSASTPATAAPQPTAAPATPAPTAETREARYLRLAQSAMRGVDTRRIMRIPQGRWNVQFATLPSGPAVTVVVPVQPAFTDRGTGTQAKRELAQVIHALFGGDATLMSITAIGTLPSAPQEPEAEIIRITVERTAWAAWDGNPGRLGAWTVSPRYR